MPAASNKISYIIQLAKNWKDYVSKLFRFDIFIGLGAGSFCPLPFTYNRVHYDHCTRAKLDGTQNEVEDFYWCPSPFDVDKDNGNLFQTNGKAGKCYDFLKPPGNQIV